jgi:hypothetical protein
LGCFYKLTALAKGSAELRALYFGGLTEKIVLFDFFLIKIQLVSKDATAVPYL